VSGFPLGASCFALLVALLCTSLGTSHARAQGVAHTLERPPDVVLMGPRALTLPPRIAAREHALALDLRELADRSSRHILHGALESTIGAGFVVAGALLHDDYARGLLILIGTGGLAQGLVQLLLVRDASDDARSYGALPMFTPDQVRARIHYGEQALARLSRAGRRTRIAQGTVTMCVASAYVPLLWWLARRSDTGHHFGDSSLDYVGLALSVIGFGSGLATALLESEAEQRYRDYLEGQLARERVAPRELERLSRRSTLEFALSVDRVQIGARLRF
jgi:hypothetical protein